MNQFYARVIIHPTPTLTLAQGVWSVLSILKSDRLQHARSEFLMLHTLNVIIREPLR